MIRRSISQETGMPLSARCCMKPAVAMVAMIDVAHVLGVLPVFGGDLFPWVSYKLVDEDALSGIQPDNDNFSPHLRLLPENCCVWLSRRRSPVE